MVLDEPDEPAVAAVLKQLRLPPARAAEPLVRRAVGDLMTALAHFAELLPAAECPAEVRTLLNHVAGTNALDSLRVERNLPVTVLLYAGVHPAYYDGPGRIGEPPWRLCYTDGGPIGPSLARERLLDEVIRLAEAMHDKNPFGEVPFDGGKTVFVQEGSHFQAVTALYGDVGMPLFILAKGGVRYYASGPLDADAKQEALRRWAASSALAGILANKYIGGPDMRMGEEEMAWVDGAAAQIGVLRRVRQHPAVTGLAAAAGGFPHQAWELTGRTVTASLKEALRHRGMAHYGLTPGAPIRVMIQGFGDVGGSVARLLTEESPDFTFGIVGVADEFGAVYRAAGLDGPALVRLATRRRSIMEYDGPVDAFWRAAPSEADRARPEFRGTDGRDLVLRDADVFIPAAIPNVITAAVAPQLRVRLVAEGANNAVAPRVEDTLHRLGILYLPGQALNWGGVKGSTLEALFRELTKRTLPFTQVEDRVRAALAPLGNGVDESWALEVLRSGLSGPPLDLDETRAFAVAILEDLARANTRWLMNELVAANYAQPPLAVVRELGRTVRTLKCQLLSLVEEGLHAEFFAPGTSLKRLQSLLDDKLMELLTDTGTGDLTPTQVVEQRQMLQQIQKEIPNGLSPVFAALLAALDLARQKVMDPEGYAQESLRRDLAVLEQADAPPARLEDSLYRLQRVHPGPDRTAFVRALANLLKQRSLSVTVRRNAAFALAKLGTADPGHRALLMNMLDDPDLSVRAACRWALHEMGIPAPQGT
jgi:glutamate dehydrogenase/leucine dehydrogenase